jgi:hypothetical protein
VPRETPTIREISRLECLPVENRWRIFAQSSNLITFHTGRWSYFQLAEMAPFSVGVNTPTHLWVDFLVLFVAAIFGVLTSARLLARLAR